MTAACFWIFLKNTLLQKIVFIPAESFHRSRSNLWFFAWLHEVPGNKKFDNLRRTFLSKVEQNLLRIVSLLYGQMCSESVLIRGQAPDAQIVNLVNSLVVKNTENDLKCINFQMTRNNYDDKWNESNLELDALKVQYDLKLSTLTPRKVFLTSSKLMSEGVASSKTVRVFLRMLRVVARTRKLKMNVQIGSMRLHSGCGHREKLKSEFDKH